MALVARKARAKQRGRFSSYNGFGKAFQCETVPTKKEYL